MHLFLGLGPQSEEQEFLPLFRHYFHGTFHVFVATSIKPHHATDTPIPIPTRTMYHVHVYIPTPEGVRLF